MFHKFQERPVTATGMFFIKFTAWYLFSQSELQVSLVIENKLEEEVFRRVELWIAHFRVLRGLILFYEEKIPRGWIYTQNI